jgi:hypothetical protein
MKFKLGLKKKDFKSMLIEECARPSTRFTTKSRDTDLRLNSPSQQLNYSMQTENVDINMDN